MGVLSWRKVSSQADKNFRYGKLQTGDLGVGAELHHMLGTVGPSTGNARSITL